MNFNGFEFDESIKSSLTTLDTQNRVPHAIIIESKDKEKSLSLAKFLSMWAVCTAENKPCGVCAQCHKAQEATHADIFYAYPEKKSKTYSIEQMRTIGNDAYIRPNEAKAKVYIFEDADIRLAPIAQNSFLKLLEEPPKGVFFILTCENSKRLLNTILSRCTVFKLLSNQIFGEDSAKKAKDIVSGILSPREYDLLLAIQSLCNKEQTDEIFVIVKLILRDGLVILSGGNAIFDSELGRKVSTRLTRSQIIQLIEITESANQKVAQNININLLTTWLCGEYRRISWQR
ncbi:MAG: hypothetical protein U0L20_04340 [Ruminococcus sp.]|nr:hypothetical protein [Ruminococcus sp.]